MTSVPTPAPEGASAVTEAATYNIAAIAKVISLSYGEDPDDDAPLGKVCGPNNEPLPNWVAYEEQAKAVFTWMMAVFDALSPRPPVPDAPDLATERAAREAAEARVSQLEAELEGQCDNMAFVVNHVTIPNQWCTKFMRELEDARAVLRAKIGG